MPPAIVIGVTGILGREIAFELAKDQEQWPTIYAASRRPHADWPSNVLPGSIDLLENVEDIAAKLKVLRAEYLFFAAFVAKPTEQEEWDVNGVSPRSIRDH